MCEIVDGRLQYEEVSKYPSIDVDITLLSNTYAPIQAVIEDLQCPLIKKTKIIDIYSTESENAITIRITFSCKHRTLVREETQQIVDVLIHRLDCAKIHPKVNSNGCPTFK